MRIRVESEIPIGAGLGSSAALSVCLAAGLHAIQEGKTSLTREDQDHVCRLALLSEQILHGTPSGIDNAISTYGGILRFKQGCVEPVEPPAGIHLRILLVNSHICRQTKDLVRKVKEQHDKYPSTIEPIFKAIDSISNLFLKTLKSIASDGDTKDKYSSLNDLIKYNQSLLEALQVSHPGLTKIIETAKDFGLYGKLTGAGGGGFAYVLLPPYVNEKTVCDTKDKLTKQGFTCYEADLGVNGVRVQFDNSNCISQ